MDFIKATKLTIYSINNRFQLIKVIKERCFQSINEASVRAITANDCEIIGIKEAGYNIRIEKHLTLAEGYFCDSTKSLIQKLKKNINEKLTPKEKQQVIELLWNFRDIFATHRFDLGKVPYSWLKVKINIGDEPIPCCKPYRLGEVKRRIMREIIEEMIKYDIIKESDAAGGAPALLVQKQDKTWRLVVNYIVEGNSNKGEQ